MNRFFELEPAYWEKFVRYQAGGPPDDLFPPELYADPRLHAMMEQALQTGVPITEADMERVFGKHRWEGVRVETAG